MPVVAIPGTTCTITADTTELTMQCLDYAINRESPSETGRTLGGYYAKQTPPSATGTATVLFDDAAGGTSETLHTLAAGATPFTIAFGIRGATFTFTDVVLTNLSDTITAEDNVQTSFSWAGLALDTATWATPA